MVACVRCEGERVLYRCPDGHGICDCAEVSEPCGRCGGTGKHPAERTLQVLREQLKKALAHVEAPPDITEDEAEDALGAVEDVVNTLSRRVA